jgi:hypothetical protein
MMKAFTFKAKRCCSEEYDNVVHKLGACEKNANTPEERHACYRREARESGRRSRQCMREGNF